METKKIEHGELHVPVSEIPFMNMLRAQQWKMAGYIPAWSQHGKLKFEDNVIFYWHRHKNATNYPTKFASNYLTNYATKHSPDIFPNVAAIKLIPKHTPLLRLVETEIITQIPVEVGF